MEILVDMDGVIADFEGEFLKRWKANHPEKPYIPHEDRKGFYVSQQYPQEYREFVEEIYLSPGFYQGLPPVEGSIEGVNYLLAQGHNVRLCTAPMLPKYENCVLEKYHWVAEHLGSEWTGRIIMTKDKTFVRGDYLIDDMPDVKGSLIPVWEHIIYSQPYNKEIDHKKRMTWDNFKEVLNV